MISHRLPPLSAPLLPVTFAVAAGIFVGDAMGEKAEVFTYSSLWLWAAWGAVAVLTALCSRRPGVQTALVLLTSVLTGCLLAAHSGEHTLRTLPQGETETEAVVASQPVAKERSVAIDLLFPAHDAKVKAYFAPDERSKSLRPGDGLRLTTRLEPLDFAPRGSFDYARYLRRHGFSGRCFVGSRSWQGAVVSLKSVGRLERSRLWFLRQRSLLLTRLRHTGLSPEALSLAAAMTLGDRSMLRPDVYDTFAQSGAAHALALSGLHLGIVYMLLSLLLVGQRMRRVLSAVVVTGLWAYAMLAGLPPSLVRAATMLTVYNLLAHGRRSRSSLSVLSFTALLMLVVSPQSLFDTGFQLSFLSMLGILLLMPLATAAVPAHVLQRHPLLRWLWGAMWLPVAAQTAVAPLVAFTFGRLPTYFLVTNVVVVPAVWLILMATLVLVVCPLPLVAWGLQQVIVLLSTALAAIASWPGASIELHPTALQTIGAYIMLAALYALARNIIKVKG